MVSSSIEKISVLVGGIIMKAVSNGVQEIKITVMSFNILHGQGILDGRVDLARVAAVIRKAGADLIGLQEVDKHYSGRSYFADQGRWLAEELGMHYVFGANLDLPSEDEEEPNRQYGTLVLSRFPIVYHSNHKLPQVMQAERAEARGLLETHLDIQGTIVRFYNTHLALDEVERGQQVEQIIAHASARTEPLIIAGDFNAAPDSREIVRLAAIFQDCLEQSEWEKEQTLLEPDPAGSGYKLTKRIDYLFSSKDIEVVEAEIIRDIVSDHLPVKATYKITGS